ncbi:MAG: hypothetical protein OXG44_01445 [Gammaproteobacteria bacterium]|nr:hypothetical protein [Gammaproteobacteria bacterium]
MPRKIFTTDAGIPLSDNPALVGETASRRTLAGTTLVPVAGWPRAALLGTAVTGTDDFLVLTAAGRRYSIARADFLALTPAHAANDDLLVGSDDVARLVSDTGTHSVLVARTSDNRPLWQQSAETAFSTVAVGDSVQVYAEEWRGGLIGQRYNTLLSHRRVTATLRKRSAAAPADPTSPTFDGEHARASGYYAYDEALPAGSDPIWTLIAEVDYDADTDAWTFGSWRKVREDAAFDLQFAAAEAGPYHSPIEAGDTWAQQRLADGSFSRFQIGGQVQSSTRTWTHLASMQMPQSPTALSDSWYVVLFEEFDPADYILLAFKWILHTNPNENVTLLAYAPNAVVRTVSTGTATPPVENGKTWKLAFPHNQDTEVMILQTDASTDGEGAAYNQQMSVDFFRVGSGTTATRLSVTDIGSDAGRGRLEVYAA